MPFCRDCGMPFEWGWDAEGDRWVLLEPIATDADLSKSFVDENGVNRADHRDRCGGGITVSVTRLRKKIPPEVVIEEPECEEVIETVGEAQDALADERGWF